MVALLPSLSDRDLRLLTPTLEELGLLIDAGDPRALGEGDRERRPISAGSTSRRTCESKELKDKLDDAADNAAKQGGRRGDGDADAAA